MLRENFLSAEELGIEVHQLRALSKTLKLLETEKLKHVTLDLSITDHQSGNEFTGHFNMGSWNSIQECGTICCIGGTAELVGNVSFNNTSIPASLSQLFYPRMAPDIWDSITPAQAAFALRNYLTTGDAQWISILKPTNEAPIRGVV